MSRKRHKPSLQVPIQKLFPNMITILGLCLGISAVRYSIDSKWQIAAGLIIVAAFMDGLDGKIARLLNSTSPFGAQLDSLADIVSFGVAPSIVIYTWSLHEIPYKGVGWAVVLFYITCSALRLARFNVQATDKLGAITAQYYFSGIPMPAAAALALTPMISSFELLDIKFSPWIIAAYMFVIGILMVSSVPTFSFKKININRKYVTLMLVSVGLLIASMVLEPWITLPIVGLTYLLLIPLSTFHYYKYFKKNYLHNQK
ncbi:CDP-diacylglycerol--serine O-phosphatidyltransferase [endosymbiont of Acanthamoeba sp. UWC8]|uniref:CDP-diacylglycerol--serine O-phosphatidyltransferase n=1 Tax=endosymbiont of Acanthamoeba sp. UWC8 TaxID=86106 RepID=UPI0004D14707|nr:CDP-diacylglycerol--serine O-phosphatidyltransferase [endosymbiont of Acanthamoeba sp. UWC8]AIF80662.1 CDP-diacylglycerol--serine O-phosphatidyltransferase [endosymbiont of Acanthamoeba sp. UWC8]